MMSYSTVYLHGQALNNQWPPFVMLLEQSEGRRGSLGGMRTGARISDLPHDQLALKVSL